MWLSLLLTVLTYLLSPRDTSKERRQALLRSIAVGGAAYAVTEYTDWGQQISASFDEAVGLGADDPDAHGRMVDPEGNVYDADGKLIVPGTVGSTTPNSPTNSNASTNSGFWKTLQSWGASGTAAVVGAGAIATSSGSKTWLLVGAGIAALLILKG